MKKIAIVFPGLGYGKEKPLLYYAEKIAKDNGYKILNLEYGDVPPVRGKIESEMRAAFDAVYNSAKDQLSDVDWTSTQAAFIAKSIGTIAANRYVKENNLAAKMIMFTPLDNTIDFHTDNKTYYFTGENDPWIDHDKMYKRLKKTNAEVLFYAGCDHSLESGDAESDIATLNEVMRQVKCVFTGEELDSSVYEN